jgi:hypothetical protein
VSVPVRLAVIAASLLIAAAVAPAQPGATYRTFSQTEFASKKLKKVGSVESIRAWFTFHNDSAFAVNSLHAKFNGHVLAVEDSGGFTTITKNEGGGLDLSGRSVAGLDSVTIRVVIKKKHPDVVAVKWWWDINGAKGPAHTNLAPANTFAIVVQPGGGNVFEFMYKHVITRPKGVVIGMKTDTPGVGWIRYKTADRKFFPHTDSSRCFDFIRTEDNGTRPFVGELKNPHVKKHNNHLLGEVHALLVAVIANDSGVTAPFDGGSNRLGDLIYNDPGNPSDPCNNMTIRQIIALTDSGLTYCSKFTAAFYFGQDSCISRVNRAFDGPIVASSFSPLRIDGTNPLPAFLHPNPAAVPVNPGFSRWSIIDATPEQSQISQNYPNPFNPTTTIEFNLAQASIVTLKVYNVLGQEVATLADHEAMEDGEQSVEFNASALSSGVYFYRILATSPDGGGKLYQATRRMLLIR